MSELNTADESEGARTERHASWAELFFDLVAAAGVSTLAYVLRFELDAAGLGLYALWVGEPWKLALWAVGVGLDLLLILVLSGQQILAQIQAKSPRKPLFGVGDGLAFAPTERDRRFTGCRSICPTSSSGSGSS